MSALTAPRDTPSYAPLTNIRAYPMDAGEKVYSGGIVVLNAEGYAEKGSTATTLLALGRANETVDNTSGADGDLKVTVEEGTFRWANGNAITQASVGALAYIVDDQTVSSLSTGKSIAGVICEVDSLGVWVRMGLEAAIDNTSLTTYINNIASNAHSVGASLVGIEDAATTITATTVEGALAEISANSYVTTAKIATNAVTEPKLSLTIVGQQALSGAGAVDITHRTTKLTSTGGSQALTLADSTVVGQRKTIVHDVDGGSMILTPTTPFHFATITFTAVHDFAELEWTSSGWIIVAYGGVTIG